MCVSCVRCEPFLNDMISAPLIVAAACGRSNVDGLRFIRNTARRWLSLAGQLQG